MSLLTRLRLKIVKPFSQAQVRGSWYVVCNMRNRYIPGDLHKGCLPLLSFFVSQYKLDVVVCGKGTLLTLPYTNRDEIVPG